jgi:phosphoribosylanthranilate isomerase
MTSGLLGTKTAEDIWSRPGIVQVAGIRNMDEARMLLDAGVHLLGFPLRLAVHREDLNDEEVARIVIELELHQRGVLITYLQRPEDIASLAKRIGVRTVQLHGEVSCDAVERLKEYRPEIFVIKSLIVRGNDLEQLMEQVRVLGGAADAFITDTFDASTGACGATGKTHDWTVSRQLVQAAGKPVLLAGGLSPENVQRAVVEVKPFGVDAHTGLERADGSKDPERVRAFVREAGMGFGIPAECS